MSKGKGINAWLVTWEGVGDDARHGVVVAVLNYRYPVRTIAVVVEQLYLALSGTTTDDKTRFARMLKANPYRAQVDLHSTVSCGANPWLYARFVRNLRSVGERHMWDEPSRSNGAEELTGSVS